MAYSSTENFRSSAIKALRQSKQSESGLVMPVHTDKSQTDEVVGDFDPRTDIVVRVIDQARSIAKDFSCHVEKVMRPMRYFASYFTGKVQL